ALVAMGAMQAAPTAILTVGVIAWLVNAVVIFLTGKIMPGVLFVRSFSTSLGASLVLMLCGWLITWLI
ncbi:MAG TPA: phage holin family protein, partial [Candidatus Obscuribacter sp.]|nr:phage holin family protein [Candidatus Obscuribacter sp.]